MRNKHGGVCYRCGRPCPPGAGHFERFKGGWRVQHAECALEARRGRQEIVVKDAKDPAG